MRTHLSSASGGRASGRIFKRRNTKTLFPLKMRSACILLACALVAATDYAGRASRYDIPGPFTVSPPRAGDARFSAEGRRLEFSGPSVETARAGWSVELIIAGRPVTLSSANAPTARLTQNQAVTRTRYGLTRESIALIADPAMGIEFELRLRQPIDVWGFSLTGKLTNRSGAPAAVAAINLMQTDMDGGVLRLNAPAAAWLATPALGRGFAPKALSLLSGGPVESPSLALFQPAGPGLFIHAIGPNFEQSRFVIRLAPAPGGELPLRAVWQGGLQAEAGASLATEELEVMMEPNYETEGPPLPEAP